MSKKYTEEDSNSIHDFADWGDRGRIKYAPAPPSPGLARLKKRLGIPSKPDKEKHA